MAGLNDVIPVQALKIFDEKEFELLLVGVADLDVDDWEASVRTALCICFSILGNNPAIHRAALGCGAQAIYRTYKKTDREVVWFWQAVRSFDKEKRTRLLQFVTGSCRVPMGGFKDLVGACVVNGVDNVVIWCGVS